MGIFDAFKGKQYKAEAENLSQQVNDLQNLLSPEAQDVASLQIAIRNLDAQATAMRQELERLNAEVEQKKRFLYVINEEMQVQDFGLYQPSFEFANSLEYKERLDEIRNRQKAMIKNNQAVTGSIGRSTETLLKVGRWFQICKSYCSAHLTAIVMKWCQRLNIQTLTLPFPEYTSKPKPYPNSEA